MFDTEELREEIEELFEEQQTKYERMIVRSTLQPDDADVVRFGFRSAGAAGFRIFNTLKTPERKKRMAKHARDVYLEDIRRRILAGERPKATPGKRGRPPTIWFKVAAEMGIDLRQTAPGAVTLPQ